MQKLIETCDRCKEESEHPLGDVKIHLGGTTFGTNLHCELCSDCLAELRVWMKTAP